MIESIVLTGEMIAVMAIICLTIILFVSESVRVDVAAMVIMVLLGLTSLVPGYGGLVPLENLFDGFSSNADEIKNASLLFDNVVIKPYQELLLDT